MTTREKNLAIAVGGVAALLVVYWGVGKYQEVKADLDREIEQKQREIAQIEKDKKLAIAAGDQWRAYGAQTLSMQPNEAQTHLRNELNRLANECGLKDVTVTVGKITEYKPKTSHRGRRKQKQFVNLLDATFRAEGDLAGITRFLYRLHARPYMVRVRSFDVGRPNSRNAPKGMLSIAGMKLETPILPPTTLVKSIVPAKLNVSEAEEQPRTELTSFDAYQKKVVKRKLFQAYENVVVKATGPHPAVGAQLQEQTQTELRWRPGNGAIGHKIYFGENTPNPTEQIGDLMGSQTSLMRKDLEVNKTYYWRVDTIHEDWEGEIVTTKGDVWNFRVVPKPPQIVVSNNEDKPPPPPTPPADAQFTVARILSSPMGQYVVLEDRRVPNNPNPPERKVELGEPLFDGTLVFVHPRGAVSEKDGQWRIHPIGQQVQAGMKPLSKENYQFGDVYLELVKLYERFKGITQRPDDRPEAGG